MEDGSFGNEDATFNDNDPTVYPEEVKAPSGDWNDAEPWGGDPPWTWYDDPASVNCRAVPEWCKAIDNATVVKA